MIRLAVPLPVITLTTDFGLQDAYAAIMKGVILGIAPDARLVDISHEVPAQSVEAGAYVLESAVRYFPSGSVHVAVVDPGVGTSRLPVAVRAPDATFVGPDNGVLFPSLRRAGAVDDAGRLVSAEAVVLENEAFMLEPVSATFHGRDIFAPMAAQLVLGRLLDELGSRLVQITPLSVEAPTSEGASVTGLVVYVDRFGNAITNIYSHDVPTSAIVVAGGTTIDGLARSYQDRDLVALIGSTGRLEIAVRNGSASALLGLKVGSRVEVRTSS